MSKQLDISTLTDAQKAELFESLKSELKSNAQEQYNKAFEDYNIRKNEIKTDIDNRIKALREKYRKLLENDGDLLKYKEQMDSAVNVNSEIETKSTSTRLSWREKYNILKKNDSIVWTVTGKKGNVTEYVSIPLTEFPDSPEVGKGIHRTRSNYIVKRYVESGTQSGKGIQSGMISKYETRLENLCREQESLFS